MNMQNLILEKLNWRYAVKKFDPSKKISESDWHVLTESLRLSPSSFGLQPWQFIVVKNPEVRKQLKAASWNQSQVEDCSHYVVLAYKKKLDEAHIQKHVEQMAKLRHSPIENFDGYKKSAINTLILGERSKTIDVWASRQLYLAIGFIMSAAAMLGIDTCPMEGLDPLAYDKILSLEGTGWTTGLAIACGYRSAEDKYQNMAKVRFDEKEVFKEI